MSNDWEQSRLLLRQIPKVDVLMGSAEFQALSERYGAENVTVNLRQHLEQLRHDILLGGQIEEEHLTAPSISKACWARFEQADRKSLKPLLNATGILLHTNLGRAPLGEQVAQRVAEVAAAYCNLEYDLETGRRGSRQSAVEALLCQLSGAEAALVVNNNAAAVLLLLRVLAQGKEAIVSRGELVEIGGSFRVPEIMSESAAILREVGTSNKTRLADYAQAINPETALLLKIHRSNFRLSGFTAECSLAELKSLSISTGIPLVYDLGSGLCLDSRHPLLQTEPALREAIQADCDLICFSGDKLLGGPQAGIILGKKTYIAKLQQHPLARALRMDKLCLSALQEVLKLYLEGTAQREIPLYRMLHTSLEELELRADLLCDLLNQSGIEAEVCSCEGEIGGGSVPGLVFPSRGVAVRSQEQCDIITLEKRLRLGEPAVIAYIRNEQLIFDLRTVAEKDLASLATLVAQAVQA